MSRQAVLVAVLEQGRAIRKHRDQVGDDRCWLDDYELWSLIDETPRHELLGMTNEEGMRRCREFYLFRSTELLDPTPENAIRDKSQWDADLADMSTQDILAELVRINRAIRTHHDIVGRPRTTDDDRVLYNVLPENIPADFRLPPEEEFLGRARPDAGCPAFWDSHGHCGNTCNLHRWGPCEKSA